MTEREKMQLFAKSETVAELMRFRFPRYAELPKLDLYMDQVLSVVSETLSVFQTEKKEKVLTAAMVNNYVKQKVLPPPVDCPPQAALPLPAPSDIHDGASCG